jgi:hypothetical protein
MTVESKLRISINITLLHIFCICNHPIVFLMSLNIILFNQINYCLVLSCIFFFFRGLNQMKKCFEARFKKSLYKQR